MKTNLAKCNKCEAILIDLNPQVDAVEIELKGTEIPMIVIREGEEIICACPNCLTDSFLVDYTEKDEVKFLLEQGSKDEVFAYFPNMIADHNGNKTCYSHIGQHSACHPDYAEKCKPAPKKYFEPLLKELESIGYELQIVK